MSGLQLPPLYLDGTSVPQEVDPVEVDRFYLPLARYLLDSAQGQRRFLVGIGGPPASGKSTFTQLLCAVLNAISGQVLAVHIGLDGWHYPNHYLDSHSLLTATGEIPLRKVKGGPPSFDVDAMLAFLRAAKAGQDASYPVYSRVLHDPQPGGQVLPSHRLILVEGNYLLLDQEPWKACQELFDRTIFLNAPRDTMIQANIERHRRGGKTREAIEAHVAFSDLPNLDLVLSHSLPADIRVEKRDSRQIAEIIYPENGRRLS